jgi:hypothetical protein
MALPATIKPEQAPWVFVPPIRKASKILHFPRAGDEKVLQSTDGHVSLRLREVFPCLPGACVRARCSDRPDEKQCCGSDATRVRVYGGPWEDGFGDLVIAFRDLDP